MLHNGLAMSSGRFRTTHFKHTQMTIESTDPDITYSDSYNQPFVGGYFSPFKDGNCIILKLVKEDDKYYYFNNLGKYPKDLPWWWFKREKPIEIIESNKPFVFPYESYSLWSRQLAESYSIIELEKIVNECEALSVKYAKQHLAAIEATTAMQSQSQRRAQSRNNVDGNSEKKRAYSNAIELHEHYPERCKLSLNGVQR